MKKATGDRLADTAKIGILVAVTTGRLHEHLVLNMDETTTYDQTRLKILDYVKSKRINKKGPNYPHDGPAPMDIDAIGTKGGGSTKGNTI